MLVLLLSKRNLKQQQEILKLEMEANNFRHDLLAHGTDALEPHCWNQASHAKDVATQGGHRTLRWFDANGAQVGFIVPIGQAPGDGLYLIQMGQVNDRVGLNFVGCSAGKLHFDWFPG